jgi:mannose-6-phosphate isomerase
MVEKPWGRDALPAPFAAPDGKRIGEIWFEPSRGFAQLLVKYIFTSEALSIQVHPSDAQTPGQGKEECWLVIAAEPGARLGLGFRETITPEAMRSAALDGTIEELLDWCPVAPGDFFYVPAGTVHAIGAGVSLIEVQQNSDVTYRLYDYGRPRELHLDQGIAVAHGTAHPADLRRSVSAGGSLCLVDGPNFRLDRLDGPASADAIRRYGTELVLVVPVAGTASIDGETVAPGQCAVAASLAALEITGTVLIAQPCTP